MAKKRSRKGECLVAGCQREVKHRGLCSACYSALWRKVEAGEMTWERAEQIGLAHGRKVSPMTRALQEKGIE